MSEYFLLRRSVIEKKRLLISNIIKLESTENVLKSTIPRTIRKLIVVADIRQMLLFSFKNIIDNINKKNGPEKLINVAIDNSVSLTPNSHKVIAEKNNIPLTKCIDLCSDFSSDGFFITNGISVINEKKNLSDEISVTGISFTNLTQTSLHAPIKTPDMNQIADCNCCIYLY